MAITRAELENRPTWVYRAWDAEGQMLYVGVTCSLWKRMARHECSGSDESRWTLLASRIEWERFETRTEALAVELATIKQERPRFNRQDNPGFSASYGQETRGQVPALRR